MLHQFAWDRLVPGSTVFGLYDSHSAVGDGHLNALVGGLLELLRRGRGTYEPVAMKSWLGLPIGPQISNALAVFNIVTASIRSLALIVVAIDERLEFAGELFVVDSDWRVVVETDQSVLLELQQHRYQ